MVTPDPIINANSQEIKDKTEIQGTKAPDVKEPTTEEIQQRNFKEFREGRERDRKAREEADKRAREKEAEAQALKAAMEALLNKQQPQQQFQQPEEPQELSEDERIQRKVDMALEAAERRRIEAQAKKEVEEMPRKLAGDFKDFDQVCSQENIDYLQFHYPEIANAYKYVPEGYDKWANVYKAIKRFVPNTNSNKDAAKAQSNLSKPQSMSSTGLTQSGNNVPAVRLDEARKAANYARMQRIMNKVGD